VLHNNNHSSVPIHATDEDLEEAEQIGSLSKTPGDREEEPGNYCKV
jgi:hypothetical protein